MTRAGGTALVIGPVRPANRVARFLAETWMLFPAAAEYTAWMEAAGFSDVRAVDSPRTGTATSALPTRLR